VLTTVALVLAWGSTFGAVKIGLESVTPTLFAGLRAVIGALVLVPIALARHGGPRFRSTWRMHAGLGLTNIVLFFGLQTVAVLELASGLAAVLIYLQPILVGLLAWRFLGEQLRPAKALGLLMGFGGIVAVSAGALRGHVSGLGVVEALGAALAWAVGTLLLKRAQEHIDPWWAVALPFVIGAVVLVAVGVSTEGWTVEWSWRFVAALLYTGLVGTASAWVLWLRLLTSGEATAASSYIFFVPIVALLLGTVFLGEDLAATLLVGAALVVAGVYLVNRRPASERGPRSLQEEEPVAR
jgi:drug/metabolite transporter (DMT)-like permease